jgi:hypothetical protein
MSAAYENVLRMAVLLSSDEQLRLIEDLMTHARNTRLEEQHSIMELCGLRREMWEGVDAQEYVHRERSSWNG